MSQLDFVQPIDHLCQGGVADVATAYPYHRGLYVRQGQGKTLVFDN